MVLRIYVILVALGIVGCFVNWIIEAEAEKRCFESKKYLNALRKILENFDKLEKVYCAIIILYNVFILIYSIIYSHYFFMISSILFLLGVLFIFISKKFKFFDFLTNGIGFILLMLCIFYTALFCMFNIDSPIDGENITEHVDLVQTIDILEFKQAPYSNITGGRYYIKSSPNSAYYYEVATENGGTTTKVIDGSSSYVEKFESDEYIDNPHIEVYRVYTITQYTSWYGNKVTKEKSSQYKYYIYTPVNAMFYEE